MPSKLAIGVLLLTLACVPCASRAVVTSADGGAAPCVQATDCPRPADVLVCGSDEDHLRGCVGCEQAACVRYTPEACR